MRHPPACSLGNSAPARQQALSLIEQRTRWSRRSNAHIRDTSALADAGLDCIIGGKATYYEMNGHWYIVGHDKHGHSTGAVQVS